MKNIMLVVLLLTGLFTFAADKKVSDLPLFSQGSWHSTDLFQIADLTAGLSKKTTVSDFDGRYYLRSAPITIAQGGTGATTQQNALDALAPPITSGTYLRSNGSHSAYDFIYANDLSGVLGIASGGTNNGSLSVTGGSIYYGDGSKIVGLANGSATQVLNSNGTTLAPSWVTLTKSSVGLGNVDNTSDATKNSASVTLTNKTLTSPVINSPTGIVKGDVGLGNVDNTSDATKNAASVTLTNKTLTSPVINTPTGIVKGDVGLGNVDNTSDATKNAAAVQLTNKDIDGGTASNTSRITIPKASAATLTALTRKQGTIVYDTTANKPYFDDGSNLQVIGSGSGSGINYITNGDAESGTSGWATYADAAGVLPVDGTSGSPTVTAISTSSSSPLVSTNSFLMAKTAVNSQGQGWSYDFTIDAGLQAKVLKIEMYDQLSSGTFTAGSPGVDSDLEVYIYDKTNGVLIQPSTYKFYSNSTTIAERFSTTFQSASNSTSYRLIFHIPTTNASAWTMKLDNIVVGPSTYTYGTPITDWVSYTSSCSGTWVSNTTYVCRSRQVGDEKEYDITLTTSGAPTATTLFVNIPDTIDTTKMSSTNAMQLGIGAVNDSLSTYYQVMVGYNSTTSVIPTAIVASGSYGITGSITATTPFTFGASDTVVMRFKAPILGKSSSVQMSDNAPQNGVVFYGTKGSTQAVTANVTDITFTSSKDSSGAWSGSAYTIPYPGDYLLIAQLSDNSTTTQSVYPFVNGVKGSQRLLVTPSGNLGNGTIFLPNLKSSDIVSLRSDQTTTLANLGHIALTKEVGTPSIGATETVSLRYTSSAAQSLPSGNTTLSYTTQSHDSHGLWNGTTFTCRSPGKYSLKAVSASAATATGLSGNVFRILKNGSAISESYYTNSYTLTANYTYIISDVLNLMDGDTIQFQFSNGFGVTTTALANGTDNYMSINKIGN